MGLRREPYFGRGHNRRRRRSSVGCRLRLERLEPRQLLSAGSLDDPLSGGATNDQQPVANTALLSAEARPGAPKNVILMIGDGMGPEHVDAGRMFLGGEIIFDQFPYQAEMTTFSANSSITDSAASASAMATGQKVNNGVIGMAFPGDGSELTTSLEIHQDLGRATGLVTTTSITHATPAAFGAHAASRNDATDIASDLLTQTQPNVLFGGGGVGMTVQDASAAGYTVVTDRDALLALDTNTETSVSGQFGVGHLPYEFDGLGNLPHLSEMTTTALDVLGNDPDGFFLMVEGGRIDHAGHGNDVERNVRETAEFAHTVEVVLDWADGRTDTLIMVTADHETGGMTILSDNGEGNVPEVTWSTTGHTGVNVPIYAWGAGAELVTGVLDNTDVSMLTTDVDLLGPVSFLELSHLDPSAGDLWFRGSTTRAGLLTLEATGGGSSGEVALTLYDEQFNQLAISIPSSASQRIDWTSDADVAYYFKLSGTNNDVDLKLANLVARGDNSITVHGTDGDDALLFDAVVDMLPGTMTHRVTINGVSYEFATPGVPSPPTFSVTFDGGTGNDGAMLTGSEGDESAALRPNSGTLTGSGYELELTNVATIAFDGGEGTDTVKLFDSAGNDALVAAWHYGRLTGDGFSNQATSVQHVEAYGSDGHDVAKLFDSRGDDLYVAAPGYARLTGDGFSLLAESFNSVHAYATAGGVDAAELFDSAGNDNLYASPTEAALFGDGFYNRAKFFESVKASATGGGSDEAELFDSAGNDRFLAMPTYARLKGDGFENQALHFDSVYARATEGGHDVVKFFDSAGNDQFLAMPAYAQLKGDGYYNQAKGFDAAYAYATAGGHDVVKFFDSAGNDRFYADPVEGAVYGDGFYNRAKYFEGVHAYATAGGHDVATLFDSAGDDTFYSGDVDGALYGEGFYNRAKHFEEVYASADAGGYDEAYLNDSPSIDLFEAEGSWARLSNAVLDFLYEAGDFDYVKATATTPGDTKVVAPSEFLLELEGPWQDP